MFNLHQILTFFVKSWKWLAGASAILILILISYLFLEPIAEPQFNFEQNQKVSAEANLQFNFPTALDHTSVEKNLIRPDDLTGELSWDGETLVFDPAEKLPFGKTLVFRIPRSTLRSDGLPLGRELEFHFVVAGTPALSVSLPADNAVEISTKSKITLVFDRPMVPLAIVSAQENPKNWPVSIEPAVAGSWRWLGTTTVEFIPTAGLTAATQYKINVPPGIPTLAGDPTVEDFSFSFETVRPTLLESEPAQDSDQNGPATKIELNFNLPIELASAKEKIHVYVGEISTAENESMIDTSKKLPELKLKKINYGAVEKDGKQITAQTQLVLTPAQILPLDQDFTVVIESDLLAKTGSLGSTATQSFHFRTAGPMYVQKGEYERRIQIQFSNELDAKTLKNQISLMPEPADWQEQTIEPEDWDPSQLSFYPNLKAGTDYTLRIEQAVRDKFGQNLPADYELKFRTADLDSRVFIHSDGAFGIFERDKPPVYYLNAVNVSKLDLEFAKLTLPEFLALRADKQDNYESTRPALTELTDYQNWSIVPHKNVRNEWEAMPFDVAEKTGKKLTPGIYALNLTAPEYADDWGEHKQIFEQQYFVLTDLAITLKYSGEQALVWVTDLTTGAPVIDAAVEFFSLANEKIIVGKTDQQGFFETPLPLAKFVTGQNSYQPEFWVTARKADDFAFLGSNWDNGLSPWNFGLNSDFRGANSNAYQLDSYIYTERSVYRPGDTAYFKGITRLRNKNGQLSSPKNQKVIVIIDDAEGNEIYKETLPLNKLGSFTGKLQLDAAASLGDYYLRAELTPADDIDGNYMGTNFSVLAYRKPEYRVDLTTAAENYFDGDKIQTAIEGAYYFGAPLAGAEVNWRANTTDYFFNRYTDGWYSFALEDAWCWHDCSRQTEILTEGSGTLDESGHLTLSLPTDLADKGVSQVVTIEADVTDPNNQIVSNRVSVPVHKAGVYVGVRAEDWAVAPGSEAQIGIIAVSPAGEPLANQKVRVKLFSRVWNTVKKKNVDGEFYFDNEAKDTFLREVSVTTNEKGLAKAQLLVEKGGQYRVVAEATDDSGRTAKAGTSIYAWSSAYVNWPHKNNNQLDIVADKPEHKVGDTAQLIVKSPYQGAGVSALVTVEREGIFSKQIVPITSSAQAIEIPITAELIPNAYVSVIIMKPRLGETFNENGLDTGAPAFRIGYTKLLVETAPKQLAVKITPDKKKYGPGETVNVTLETRDAIGRPVAAELSLGVVDLSVLALTGFELPDLVRTFYAERGLGIVTSEMLTYLLERFKPGSKGGGGADPGQQKRGDFKDTAYWNPLIETDKNGRATVQFKLPDNLTTWQLLAIAQTGDSLFGAVAEEVVETKKVILRPVRPRFAVVGDEIQLGAIVHNFLDSESTFDVTLTGTGFAPLDDTQQTIKLKSGESTKLNFPVRVAPGEKITLNFTAANAVARDEIEETLPIYAFGTPQSVATSGSTTDRATELIAVPAAKDASTGTLDLIVSPTLATYLPAGLEYLVDFPYGCTEQTVSSFLPNIAIAQLQNFEAFQIVEPAKLKEIVTTSLQKIYQSQRADGGWGYWEGSSLSFPYLSAYVVFALSETKDAGYAVDEAALARARNYLAATLRSNDPTDQVSLATRAYILFVLAEGGQTEIALLNNLYETKAELPIFARAQLAMALHKAGTKQTINRAQTLLTEIVDLAHIDPRGTHFVESAGDKYSSLMQTDARTTATVLQALVRIDPENPLLGKTLRYLLATRENGHWDTTQSTTTALLALTEYLQQTGELDADFVAGVKVGDKQILDQKFNAENVLTKKEFQLTLAELARGEETKIEFGKSGTGQLYYDLLLNYFYTADELPPVEAGLGILRELRPLTDKPSDKYLTEAKVGETYKVKLTVTVPETRHFVAVESPLPAGFEAIDVQLKTSSQVGLTETTLDCRDNWSEACWRSGLWHFNHTELRDDRVFLFADSLPPGVYEYEYLVRATTPGKFRLRPAKVWEMYFPEVFGQTDGNWFEIHE